MEENFYRKVEDIIKKDKRYHQDAYEFIMEALYYTQKKINQRRHITAQELLEGFKDLAREQFGPMAISVLAHWGINSTEDVGEIIFNLVDNKLLSKTQEDSKDDFKANYDFKDIFQKEYKEMISRQIKRGGL